MPLDPCFGMMNTKVREQENSLQFVEMKYICSPQKRKMSIVILQDGTEVFRFCPVEFRRTYTLTFGEDGAKQIEYSHTDCICALDNKTLVHAEVVQGVLTDGTYVVKTLPTDLTFSFKLRQIGTASVSHLKKIIFMTFPNLPTKDVYLGEEALQLVL